MRGDLLGSIESSCQTDPQSGFTCQLNNGVFGPNDNCGDSNECKGNMNCVGGICVPLKVDEPCLGEDCAFGHHCVNETGICTPLPKQVLGNYHLIIRVKHVMKRLAVLVENVSTEFALTLLF